MDGERGNSGLVRKAGKAPSRNFARNVSIPLLFKRLRKHASEPAQDTFQDLDVGDPDGPSTNEKISQIIHMISNDKRGLSLWRCLAAVFTEWVDRLDVFRGACLVVAGPSDSQGILLAVSEDIVANTGLRAFQRVDLNQHASSPVPVLHAQQNHQCAVPQVIDALVSLDAAYIVAAPVMSRGSPIGYVFAGVNSTVDTVALRRWAENVDLLASVVSNHLNTAVLQSADLLSQLVCATTLSELVVRLLFNLQSQLGSSGVALSLALLSHDWTAAKLFCHGAMSLRRSSTAQPSMETALHDLQCFTIFTENCILGRCILIKRVVAVQDLQKWSAVPADVSTLSQVCNQPLDDICVMVLPLILSGRTMGGLYVVSHGDLDFDWVKAQLSKALTPVAPDLYNIITKEHAEEWTGIQAESGSQEPARQHVPPPLRPVGPVAHPAPAVQQVSRQVPQRAQAPSDPAVQHGGPAFENIAALAANPAPIQRAPVLATITEGDSDGNDSRSSRKSTPQNNMGIDESSKKGSAPASFHLADAMFLPMNAYSAIPEEVRGDEDVSMTYDLGQSVGAHSVTDSSGSGMPLHAIMDKMIAGQEARKPFGGVSTQVPVATTSTPATAALNTTATTNSTMFVTQDNLFLPALTPSTTLPKSPSSVSPGSALRAVALSSLSPFNRVASPTAGDAAAKQAAMPHMDAARAGPSGNVPLSEGVRNAARSLNEAIALLAPSMDKNGVAGCYVSSAGPMAPVSAAPALASGSQPSVESSSLTVQTVQSSTVSRFSSSAEFAAMPPLETAKAASVAFPGPTTAAMLTMNISAPVSGPPLPVEQTGTGRLSESLLQDVPRFTPVTVQNSSSVTARSADNIASVEHSVCSGLIATLSGAAAGSSVLSMGDIGPAVSEPQTVSQNIAEASRRSVVGDDNASDKLQSNFGSFNKALAVVRSAAHGAPGGPSEAVSVAQSAGSAAYGKDALERVFGLVKTSQFARQDSPSLLETQPVSVTNAAVLMSEPARVSLDGRIGQAVSEQLYSGGFIHSGLPFSLRDVNVQQAAPKKDAFGTSPPDNSLMTFGTTPQEVNTLLAQAAARLGPDSFALAVLMVLMTGVIVQFCNSRFPLSLISLAVAMLCVQMAMFAIGHFKPTLFIHLRSRLLLVHHLFLGWFLHQLVSCSLLLSFLRQHCQSSSLLPIAALLLQVPHLLLWHALPLPLSEQCVLSGVTWMLTCSHIACQSCLYEEAHDVSTFVQAAAILRQVLVTGLCGIFTMILLPLGFRFRSEQYGQQVIGTRGVSRRDA